MKTTNLPFANALKNYSELIKDVTNEYIGLNKEEFEFLKDTRNCNINANNNKINNLKHGNLLLFILNCLQNTFISYCKLAVKYIRLYKNDDSSFISEYSKIYSTYIESAIKINV